MGQEKSILLVVMVLAQLIISALIKCKYLKFFDQLASYMLAKYLTIL